MVLLLIVVTILNYLIGLSMISFTIQRKRLMKIGVAANIIILLIFKYASFIVDNLNAVLGAVGLRSLPDPHITLPLGLSFFTFQAISYVVDIYRRDISPETNLIRMGVFKAFFPQLIAGPIVRYREIAGDLRNRHVTVDSFSAGVERFTIGLGKKLLIADPLSIPVDRLFSSAPSSDLSSPLAWMGLISFGLQIYFDFSGYSDMAIGLAMIFGFRFPENFNAPYTALSVQDFWRRWHMTLSRWFRDYLYIPLGGNRAGPLRTALNLWIVFATTGFWHGANWTFLVWGLWHGAFLSIERTRLGRVIERLPQPLQNIYAIFAVLLGWVWFRTHDLQHGVAYMRALFLNGLGDPALDIARYFNPYLLFVFAIGCLIALRRVPRFHKLIGQRPVDGRHRDVFLGGPLQSIARTISLTCLALVAFSASAASTLQAFIYFRF